MGLVKNPNLRYRKTTYTNWAFFYTTDMPPPKYVWCSFCDRKIKARKAYILEGVYDNNYLDCFVHFCDEACSNCWLLK